jgi:SP family arabinose:H+ symporter-like MFS transporter
MNVQTRQLFWIAVTVSLGGFVFGFDASVISGVVGYVSREYHLDVWQEGLVVSAPTLAAVLASLTVVPLSDVVGRKRMLLIVAVLYVVSAVLAAFASGFVMLVIARAIGGLAFGSLMITPVYVAEISPARMRGVLVSVNQMNIVVGLSAAYFSNYLLVALTGRATPWITSLGLDHHTWRWMLGMEIVPSAIWVVLLCFVPESPRWLVVKGRPEAARAILRRLVLPTEVEPQIVAVQQTARGLNSSQPAPLRQIFQRKLRYVMLIGMVVGIAQQITGINAVFFFATSIFEQSGVGTDGAFAQAVWVGLINVVFTVVAMLLIDRVGRRPLLLAGLAGVVVSMSIAGWGFYQATYRLDEAAILRLAPEISAVQLAPLAGQTFHNDVEFKRAASAQLGAEIFKRHESKLIQSAIRINPYVVLAGILGFVASFAVSLGPVMWVVLSEIFPNEIRGVAIAAVGFVNASVSFLVQFIFPWELATLGNAGTFLLYGAFAVIFFLLVARIMPETKNRTLEELEVELALA